jgi:trehalose 6-phosphate phosphatase
MEAQTQSALARLNALAQRYPGVVIERKPFGFAIHYRLSPEAEASCYDFAAHIAKDTGLALQPGKMVVELKAANANKGRAVESFMREPPMTGTRPIFVGDDETDEAGFAMAALLGGAGVLVGATRSTAAVYQLPGVNEALTWLGAASRA